MSDDEILIIEDESRTQNGDNTVDEILIGDSESDSDCLIEKEVLMSEVQYVCKARTLVRNKRRTKLWQNRQKETNIKSSPNNGFPEEPSIHSSEESVSPQKPLTSSSEEPMIPYSEEQLISNSGEPSITSSEEPSIHSSEQPLIPNSEEPSISCSEDPSILSLEDPVIPYSEEPLIPSSEEPPIHSSAEPVIPYSEEPSIHSLEEPVIIPSEEPSIQSEQPLIYYSEEPSIHSSEEPVISYSEEPLIPFSEEPSIHLSEEPVIPYLEEPSIPSLEESLIGEHYECSFKGCNEEFNNAFLHYKHEKKHSNELIRKRIATFGCHFNDCSFKGLTQIELIYHNSEHEGIFLCRNSECMFRANDKQCLTQHMKRHRNAKKRPLNRNWIK